MNQELEKLIASIKQLYEIDISMYSERFLLKSIEKRETLLEKHTPEEYRRILEMDEKEVREFKKSLNITYSEFFRNQLTFATLENIVLPRLINQKSGNGELRVWSAGCAAGQEAYSIAMLLDKLVTEVGKGLKFRVIATDISAGALEIAKRGIYEPEAMGNVKLKQLNKYFTMKGDCYEVKEGLRESVNFYSYNLLDTDSNHPPESIYGEFDLVFCSNLLFYYKPEAQRFILNKMGKSMGKNGYLITGEAERALVDTNTGFSMIHPQISVFQMKKDGGAYGREI